MSFNHKTSLGFSGGVFVILLFVGFILSQHKLLWIDECFTQHEFVDKSSYADILTLHIPNANKDPLFYILQKINADIFSFRYPDMNAEGSYDASDRRSQIIIRIPSNIYMSLALASIFYYFIRFYSLYTAFYALAVALVSPMVWMYWVEARQYSLWFLLTTAQLLFYCFICRSGPAARPRTSRLIYLVHVLLVLTTPGTIMQVFIMALLLFIKGGYKKRQLIWSFLLPLVIFLAYYFLVPLFRYKTFNIFTCLFESALPERLLVYVIYALTAWGLSKREKLSSNIFFLPVFSLFFLSACFVLIRNLFVDDFQFGFFNRYLIYLVPADTIMFTLASFDLWHWSRRNSWVCMNLSIILAGLLIVRGLLTYRNILSSALYLHSSG